MISYLIDEVPRTDLQKLRAHLKDTAMPSSMEGLFWVPLPEDILSETQYDHEDCKPHVFAVELGDDWIKMEFFVRNLANMRCTCSDYATRQQRDFIIRFAHTLIRDLGIRT
jgi:hypothetical protein